MPVPVDRVVVLARPRPVATFPGLVARARAAAGLPGGEAFALFLAVDEPRADPAALEPFLDACLRDGMYAVSAWGPGCERVHDLVVILDVILDVDEPGASPGHVLTAWHANETAAEAVGFFLTYASAVEGRPDGRWLLIVTDDHVDTEAVRAPVHQEGPDAFTLHV